MDARVRLLFQAVASNHRAQPGLRAYRPSDGLMRELGVAYRHGKEVFQGLRPLMENSRHAVSLCPVSSITSHPLGWSSARASSDTASLFRSRHSSSSQKKPNTCAWPKRQAPTIAGNVGAVAPALCWRARRDHHHQPAALNTSASIPCAYQFRWSGSKHVCNQALSPRRGISGRRLTQVLQCHCSTCTPLISRT